MNRQQRRASKSKKKNTLRLINGVLVNSESSHGFVSSNARGRKSK